MKRTTVPTTSSALLATGARHLCLALDLAAGATQAMEPGEALARERVGAAFSAPVELRSEGGQLSVTMEARPTFIRLGDREISGATYNGVYGGPVLRLKPGDTLHFRLVNHLAQFTNVHFHGLAVSPEGIAVS